MTETAWEIAAKMRPRAQRVARRAVGGIPPTDTDWEGVTILDGMLMVKMLTMELVAARSRHADYVARYIRPLLVSVDELDTKKDK